jgi:hypothetical protein
MAASVEDQRYLLLCAVQKARVSTEGVKVMALLSDCIGARGFEADNLLRDGALATFSSSLGWRARRQSTWGWPRR